jgi:hypothetical protein
LAFETFFECKSVPKSQNSLLDSDTKQIRLFFLPTFICRFYFLLLCRDCVYHNIEYPGSRIELDRLSFYRELLSLSLMHLPALFFDHYLITYLGKNINDINDSDP